MGIFPYSSGVAIAQALKQAGIMLAWGDGGTDPIDPDATGLQNEIGRRRALSVDFVVADPAGQINVAGYGRFSVSPEPTNKIVVTTKFDYEDALGETVNELGLFVGTVVDPALPLGQMYFKPDQIADPGTLLLIDHITPFDRTPGVRELIRILVQL